MTSTQESIVYDLEYGMQKGYLQKKIVFLKPIPNKKLTLTNKDRQSIHNFMYEGAIIDWCLPMDETWKYFDPFTKKVDGKEVHDQDEQKFFEAMLGEDLHLNHSKADCFWNVGREGQVARVRFEVDPTIKAIGYKFDLSVPQDVIKYKIAKMQYNVISSTQTPQSHHVWMLVDKDEEEKAVSKATQNIVEAYIALGKLSENAEKAKEFLELYFMTKKQNKSVPGNITLDGLTTQLRNLVDLNAKEFAAIYNDPDKDIKLLLLRGIKCGAITKSGVNSYEIPNSGLGVATLEETIDSLKVAKKNRDTDDNYDKLIARIELAESK
jgi:hypothetical protein